MIQKSAYNFIPAPREEQVFKPQWAEQVSHDIPFEDGECGEIEIKITAQTPIFVRNGHSKHDKELYDSVMEKQKNGSNYQANKEEKEGMERYLSFSHFVNANGEKEFFIPATSLKGMIRNTLEVFSFSRLKTKNDIFSFRKIDHRDYLSEQKKVKSGWLYKKGDNEWEIVECKHDNVTIKDIEKKYNVKLQSLDAVSKYRKIKEKCFEEVTVYFNKQLGFSLKNGKFIQTTKVYQFSDNQGASINGQLVLYGSIDNKVREYIFHSRGEKTYHVDKALIERFEEVDNKLPEETSLWKFFRKENVTEMPVFFYVEDDKESSKNNQQSVKHFGFSKLYKRTHTHRLHELSPILSYLDENDRKPDLSTTIFGELEDEKEEQSYTGLESALKGRVFFGHCKITDSTVEELPTREYILSNPKASFYPFYLKDKKTYMDKDAELSGFKKYPIHEKENTNPYFPNDTEDVRAKIKPLPSNVEFTGKIRFHNLKKMEIGALLSALTFHNNSGAFLHSLGGAKPFGYGKVKIEVCRLNYLQYEEKEYITTFENHMNLFLKGNTSYSSWTEAYPIQAFFAMSMDNNPNINQDDLEYPKLENPENKENEFAKTQSLPDVKVDNIKIEKYENRELFKRYEEIKTASLNEKYSFIKKHQHDICLQSLIDSIYEEVLYLDDIKTIEECQQIISQFKDDKAILKRIYFLKEEQAYLQIKDSNDIAELTRFLEDYQDTSHRFEVEQKVAVLEEEAAYQALMPIDEHKNREEEVWLNERKEKLMAFKEKYRSSDKTAEVNKAISEIEQQLSRLKDSEVLDLNFAIPSGADMQEIKDIIKPIIENKAFEGFNDEGKNKICKAIEDLWENEKTKGKKNLFYKKDKLLPINKYPWTDIAKWLKDEDRLNTLYDKLTSMS